MNRKVYALFGIFIIAMFLVPTVAVVAEDAGLTLRGKPAPVSVTLDAPTNGETVSGVVTILVSCDKTPDILIDGVKVARALSFDWDTTAYADGDHEVVASYRGSTDAAIVTVANGGGGGDPPPDPGTGDGVVRKWALCIGISDYETDANDLTYCDEDAQDWKSYLQGEGYTVDLLLDRQATADNIIAALQALVDAEDGDDMVAITYSGHGYYSRNYRESGWISTDEWLVLSSTVASFTDAMECSAIFMFHDCCNAGTFSDCNRDGMVNVVGSTKTSYTYDGTSDMANGILTYYAIHDAIEIQHYFTAEDIGNRAAQLFNANTPGRCTVYDNYSGDLDL
jgi:hypothetical protein